MTGCGLASLGLLPRAVLIEVGGTRPPLLRQIIQSSKSSSPKGGLLELLPGISIGTDLPQLSPYRIITPLTK